MGYTRSKSFWFCHIEQVPPRRAVPQVGAPSERVAVSVWERLPVSEADRVNHMNHPVDRGNHFFQRFMFNLLNYCICFLVFAWCTSFDHHVRIRYVLIRSETSNETCGARWRRNCRHPVAVVRSASQINTHQSIELVIVRVSCGFRGMMDIMAVGLTRFLSRQEGQPTWVKQAPGATTAIMELT